MTRRALVTGATGFIGRALVSRLIADGWHVDALVRVAAAAALPSAVNVHAFAGGVEALTRIVKAAEPTVVFHLASLYLTEHLPDQVAALVRSNVELTAELAEAMTATGARLLVNTGTAWQHFEGSDRPVNLYAATKQAGQDLLRFYEDARGLSVATLKLFDTYGPGDTRRKLVQLLVEAAMSGEPLGMSPGEQVIDLSHVSDVVAAFLAAADHLMQGEQRGGTFFVSGQRLTVRALAEAVGSALGRPVPARFGERPYRAREVMIPAENRPLVPGWAATTSLADGIRALAESR